MTPELIYIFKLFIGGCVIFFGASKIIVKVVEGLAAEARANQQHINKNEIKNHEFIDMNTSPVYSYLPNNIFHQN